MSKALCLCVAVILLASLPAAAGEKAQPAVLVEIGEEKFTAADFQLYLRQINPRMEYEKLPAGEQRHWLEEFITHKLLAARARAAGLHRQPELAARLAFFEERVLAQALRDQLARDVTVSEDELRARYAAEPPMLPARVLLEQLLYRDAAAAAAAQARLRAGVAFAELAGERGQDASLRRAERSWFTSQQLPPEVASAAFELEPGVVSEVIRSVLGFHVLRVEEREAERPQEFAAARAELLEQLRRAKAAQLAQQVVEEAKQQHGVKVYSELGQR